MVTSIERIRAEIDEDEKQKPGPRLTRLADVKPERVEWLWPARIPLGMLTLIDGDPGLGKSTVGLDLAARVSTGAAMPFETATRPPADVVVLSAEDHLAATLRPRLDAADADVTRVHALVAAKRDGKPEAPPTLPTDLDQLEIAVRTTSARLVIIDPLMAYLGGEVDAHRDQDVRRALAPLSKLAETTGAAIVIVRHLRKSAGSAIYRGGGSIGIVGAARSALMAAKDPDDPSARLLAMAKGNLAAPAPTLRWRLVDAGGVARVEWMGIAADVSADDLAAPPPAPTPEERDQVDQAAAALRELLADGAVAAGQAERAVRAHVGCSERTVRRAKDLLGVEARQRKGSGRSPGWEWFLPSAASGGQALNVGRLIPEQVESESEHQATPSESAHVSGGHVSGGQGQQTELGHLINAPIDDPEPHAPTGLHAHDDAYDDGNGDENGDPWQGWRRDGR